MVIGNFTSWKTDSIKQLYLCAILFLITLMVDNKLLAQFGKDVPDGDDIPYGMSEVSGTLDIDRYRNYHIQNRIVNGANTDVIESQKGIAQLGLGLDLHCCFTNMFGLYNDDWRFRIGEDVGFSINVLNGAKLSGFAGLQGVFRLGELVDVGIKYYPLYSISWWSGGPGKMSGGKVGNNAFGIHARIGPTYLDYTNIKAASSLGNNDPARFHLLKIKCNYDDFEDGKFISVSFGMVNFSTGAYQGPFQTPLDKEYSKLKNRLSTIQLGWGVAF